MKSIFAELSLLVRGVMVGTLGLSCVSPVMAQTEDTGLAFPLPIVTAEFPVPAHAVDWNRYRFPDQCQNVGDRTRAVERYSRIDLSSVVDQQRNQVAARTNPWAPFPASTPDITRQCISHVNTAKLSAFEVAVLVRLAIVADTDSLVQRLVAQQVASVGASREQQAAVLDTAVTLLMDSHGLPGQAVAAQPSVAHVQLARAYAVRADTQLSDALARRESMHLQLRRPARYAHLLDTLLALNREELQLMLQESPAQRIENGVESDSVLRVLQDSKYAYLTWLKTGAYDVFMQSATTQQRIFTRDDVLKLLGTMAPPVPGDYCFASPRETTPTAVLTPAIPARGTMTLVVYAEFNAYEYRKQLGMFSELRRLHHEFPNLAIATLSATTGRFRSQYLEDHPEREAVMIHQYLADSLGVPGSLCVVKGEWKKAPPPDGRVTTFTPRLLQNSPYTGNSILIDFQGRIVDVENPDDWETVIRRLSVSEQSAKK